MPITVNKKLLEEGQGYETATGQTEGNEVIFKLNASQRYIVDCVVTSAGTASLKGMTGTTEPTDFSAMAIANDGTQTTNFSREVDGWSYVGLDIASSSGGTWTTVVRRVD